MSARRIQLQSSDGEVIKLDVEVAQSSLTIKQMFELEESSMDDTEEVIPIPPNAPHISGAILRKIIDWINHPKHDDLETVNDDREVKLITNDEFYEWDEDCFEIDQETLFPLIRATDFLNVQDLLEVACKSVADMMKGMSAEKVREKFNISCDLSQAEAREVGEIYKWSWFGGNNWRSEVRDRIMNGRPESIVQAMSSLKLNDEATNVIADCLRNQYMVGKICQHFSNAELLVLSLVNQVWNFEARRLIRIRSNLVARIPIPSCQQYFDQFGAALHGMKDALFSGIFIELFASDHDGACAAREQRSLPDPIFIGLPWKCLKFLVHENWFAYSSCPSFLLAKRVLRDFRCELQDLSLEIHTGRAEFIKEILQIGVVQDSSFPALKIFKLQGSYHYSDPYANCCIVNALGGHAPNLQELHIGAMLSVALMRQEFDFTAMFPKLNKVCVFGHYTQLSPNPIYGLIEEANAALKEPLPNPAVNVRELELPDIYMTVGTTKFFVRMFPNVTKLAAVAFNCGTLNGWINLDQFEYISWDRTWSIR